MSIKYNKSLKYDKWGPRYLCKLYLLILVLPSDRNQADDKIAWELGG